VWFSIVGDILASLDHVVGELPELLGTNNQLFIVI